MYILYIFLMDLVLGGGAGIVGFCRIVAILVKSAPIRVKNAPLLMRTAPSQAITAPSCSYSHQFKLLRNLIIRKYFYMLRLHLY